MVIQVQGWNKQTLGSAWLSYRKVWLIHLDLCEEEEEKSRNQINNI